MIEILVVIIIIGILATLGSLSFMPSLEKSRDGRRKADLANITKALEAYNTDHGSYPTSDSGLIVACGDGTVTCEWGQPFTDEKGTVYMARLPEDPHRFEYFYLFDPTVGGYALLARMENEMDPVRAMTAGTPALPGVYTDDDPPVNLDVTACGGDGCSYVQFGPAARPILPIVADDGETGTVPMPP